MATLLLFWGSVVFAQSAYEKTMAEKLTKMKQSKTADEYAALSNEFAKIGDAEKTQWLPYYYAALSTVRQGWTLTKENKTEGLDPVSETAFGYISKAEALNPNKTEILLLKKMALWVKMMVDPMGRFMTDGQAAQTALDEAAKLEPDNPRVYLLQGEDSFYIPEQYGGSKVKAKELFLKAKELFKTYKPKTPLDPNWGEGEADNLLSQIK